MIRHVPVLARAALAIAISLASSSCAVTSDKREVDDQTASTLAGTSKRIDRELRRVTLEQKLEDQIVDTPFLASSPRAISRDELLPPVLQGKIKITSVFPDKGRADLMTVAKRIQDASGVVVRVTPDALMDLSSFGPRLDDKAKVGDVGPISPLVSANTGCGDIDCPIVPTGVSGQPAIQPTPTPAAVPVKTPAVRSTSTGGEELMSVVLDRATAPLGAYWRWDENARQVVIYRTETRAFEIRGAEWATKGSQTLNQTGAQGETGNNSVDSRSENVLSLSKMSDAPIEDVIKQITQYMTQSGQIAQTLGNTIIVTDTKDSLDRIQAFVDQENKIRSRTVELTLEEVTVEHTRSSQQSANWNLLFSGGSDGAGVNVSGLNSLLEQEGAAATLGLSVNGGPWQGSSIAVQALSKLGKIVSSERDTLSTNNRVPVTMGDPERRKYPDKSTQTPTLSDSQKPTVSVTQAVESWGRIITVTPVAYSNGEANVAIKFDNTPQPRFDKNSFPDGSYVISPWSKGKVLASLSRVRSGQPYVIMATQKDSNGYNSNRVDRDAPIALGGSDVADKTERVTLLVLTAMIKER